MREGFLTTGPTGGPRTTSLEFARSDTAVVGHGSVSDRGKRRLNPVRLNKAQAHRSVRAGTIPSAADLGLLALPTLLSPSLSTIEAKMTQLLGKMLMRHAGTEDEVDQILEYWTQRSNTGHGSDPGRGY